MSDEQLEDALRAKLRDAIDPRVPGPAAEGRVLAAVTDAEHSAHNRVFRVGPRLGAALAAAMVVLVVGGALGVSLALRGSRTGPPAPAASVSPVITPLPSPSPSTMPSPHPSPVPTQSAVVAGIQPCTAAMLSAKQYDQDGIAGSSGGDIALRNDGTVACTLEGYVNLQGVVNGRVVQLGVTHSVDAQMLNNNNGTLPTVRLITLRPGKSAYVAYEVSDVINGPTPCSSTQTLLITPPHDGATVRLTDTLLSLCGGFHTTLWIDIAPVSSVPFYNTAIP